jgi:hypothetical protein
MKTFAFIEKNFKNAFSLISRKKFHSSTLRRAKAGKSPKILKNITIEFINLNLLLIY